MNAFSNKFNLDAWAKSQTPDATQAAERLLGKMMENPRLEPSCISYNAVLDSHAHSSDPESLTRMTKIWNHMQREADKGATQVRPNLRTINTILTAFVRNVEMNKDPEAKIRFAQRARNFFDDVQTQAKDERAEITPDIMTYSILMDAFARVGSTEAALQAEMLMRELKEAYQKSGDVKLKPNFRTYTTLISAWSRSYDPKGALRAEALLTEMEEMYAKRLAEGKPLAHGEETTKPNARTYTYVIQAISRSNDDNKAKRALKMLKKMRELAKTSSDCAPLLSTYNQGMSFKINLIILLYLSIFIRCCHS
jgi:pentatricopeptide repeat protein